MEAAGARLSAILTRAESLSVDPGRLAAARLLARASSSKRHSPVLYFLAGFASVTVALAYTLQLHTHPGLARALLSWRGYDVYLERCAISLPDKLTNWVRPAEDCNICQGLSRVDTVSNILPDEFEEKSDTGGVRLNPYGVCNETVRGGTTIPIRVQTGSESLWFLYYISRYAYSGRPVVVLDGVHDWPGRQTFSFHFFKDLYNRSLEQIACQFFPYDTEFRNLYEVFNMSVDRAELKHGTKPWYIGWSNCDNQVARILKEQYSRPYFLPETSENKQVDWIFMGSPGYGAKMHVDSVSHPSWQAQLRGRKKWTLQPPPECIYQCKTLEVIVNPGQIIVLDTNRWYHQTLILPGEMSITIGAEYD